MAGSDESEKPSPRSLALYRLSRREHSARELESHLLRKGVEQTDARTIVDQLRSEGMIDDRRFATALIRDQSFKDKGPMHVLSTLRQKGVRMDLSEVKEIFNEVARDEEPSMIRDIVDRRFPRASKDEKEWRRAYQALLRRGFSPDAIRKVLGARFSTAQKGD